MRRARRVLVTRAAAQSGKLSEALRAIGVVPVEVPVLEIQPPDSYDDLDAALRELNQYDWLLFTSMNSVVSFQVRARDLGVPITDLKPRIAAVGNATAQALEALMHLKAALTPKEYVAESLVAGLKNRVAGKRILLARAAIARDVIPDALRDAGATVDVVDAYRNMMPSAAPEQLREALSEGLDAATFTSSSSVTHLAEAAQEAGLVMPFEGVAAVSIGPITSATLREHHWEPVGEADPHDIAGLVEAVQKVLGIS